MKKRLLIVNLVLALVLALSFGLTACGDNGNGGDPQTVAVASVTLNKNTLTLDIGGSETLTATVKPDNATNKTVTWTVAPVGIVTVSNGTVTAVSDGTATVSATADGKSATCTVTVNPPIGGKTDVTSVTLNKSEITLDIGDTETLTATVLPENATYKTVSWSSDKPAIADVDDDGTVTAKADGTAVITATADGVSDTCTVTVNKSDDENEPLFGMVKIAKALEDKIGCKVLTLVNWENQGANYLAFIGTTYSDSVPFYAFYGTKIPTADHDLEELTENDLSYYLNAINSMTSSDYRALTEYMPYHFGYHTDGSNKEFVEQIFNRVASDVMDGKEYQILYAYVSGAVDDVFDGDLGHNSKFTVGALLMGNDGNIYYYHNSINAATDGFESAYQAVLTTNAYKENNETLEIARTGAEGTVAKAYLDELAAYEAYQAEHAE